MIKWHLETRKISALKDHPKNPRKLTKHQEEHLKLSIDKFGLIDKPIINTDNQIIGGHQRKRILKKMGLKEIECYVPDRTLDEKEVEELNIRLNQNQGEWDFDILANQFEFESLVEWGFDPVELVGDLGMDQEAEQIEAEEDGEVLEPGKDEDAITKPGDIYELGDHRLVCGDSTMPDDVAKCLNGNEPILMVTDPPYGVNYDPLWRSKTKEYRGKPRSGKVENDDQADWRITYSLFPGAIAYIWHADKMAIIVAQNLMDCDFEIKYQIIWQKQKGFSRGDYHHWHEPCWYCVKKKCSHNWQGDRKQRTLWEINTIVSDAENPEEGKTNHSTQKPLECMARPIRNNSAKGEGVYDPFLGSGTTLIAAEQLKRKCYGIEISPAYCDIIVNRWIKYRQKNNLSTEFKKNGETFTELSKTETNVIS